MINLKLINHAYLYEVCDIIKLYYGKEPIKTDIIETLVDSQGFLLVSELYYICSYCVCISSCYNNGELKYAQEEKVSFEYILTEKEKKQLIKKSMYKLLQTVNSKSFPWGILTGIRPIKIVHSLMDKGYKKEAITDTLKHDYLISGDRAELAYNIASVERPFIYPQRGNYISVYIGIPFCPTRCHYCSFTSNSIIKYKDFVDLYLSSLKYEIEKVFEFLNSKNVKVQSVYIGGGTPTSLSSSQLSDLLQFINMKIANTVEEFSCEAGRPDTITRDKLKALKEGGVTRISINPQTLNEDTLKLIGRNHSVKQFFDSFHMAREEGFNNINVDLIIGLPGEGIEHINNTLNYIKQLHPENLTVHTMAIKRASIINEKFDNKILSNSEMKIISEIINKSISEMKMYPYYLYRQKHMIENMENIGYCISGHECLYNIQIIEERQTIVAFGADASTKVVFGGDRIERQANIKDLKLYINNIQKNIDKKLELLSQLYG